VADQDFHFGHAILVAGADFHRVCCHVNLLEFSKIGVKNGKQGVASDG
jgi:hypothetical protein